jgi:uncharacterized protein YjeT (DUF2065 family)
MDASILLARILGIAFIVCYASILINPKIYRRMSQEVVEQSLATFISGFCALILGLLILQFHSIWEWNWKGLITFFGWLTFIKGSLLILFPQALAYVSQKVYTSRNQTALRMMATLMFLIGVYLTYIGFSGS